MIQEDKRQPRASHVRLFSNFWGQSPGTFHTLLSILGRLNATVSLDDPEHTVSPIPVSVQGKSKFAKNT